MSWSWRYLDAADAVLPDGHGPAQDAFPTQSDAESWLGECWRELAAAGVARVTLLDGDREVYGPMSLDPLD